MSELRERLAHKRRRRVTVSVAVEDATEAVAAVSAKEREALTARMRGESEEREQYERELVELKAAVRAMYVEIEFQAVSPSEFESLQTDFVGTDGGIDQSKLAANLPMIAAACVVDDDLRDEEFWREQLDSGAWSFGERVNLANRLIGLNVGAPDERIPFG